MRPLSDTITFDEAVTVAPAEPSADVLAWQAEKIRAGIKAADEGRFATLDQVRAVIQKFIPNG